MTVKHKGIIHAVCPHGGWDYYDITLEPINFVTVEDFQGALDNVRGLEMYQENLAGRLYENIGGKLIVTGRHGVTDTVVILE